MCIAGLQLCNEKLVCSSYLVNKNKPSSKDKKVHLFVALKYINIVLIYVIFLSTNYCNCKLYKSNTSLCMIFTWEIQK